MAPERSCSDSGSKRLSMNSRMRRGVMPAAHSLILRTPRTRPRDTAVEPKRSSALWFWLESDSSVCVTFIALREVKSVTTMTAPAASISQNSARTGCARLSIVIV